MTTEAATVGLEVDGMGVGAYGVGEGAGMGEGDGLGEGVGVGEGVDGEYEDDPQATEQPNSSAAHAIRKLMLRPPGNGVLYCKRVASRPPSRCSCICS